jgi:SAM-dependent methyltransferase
MKNYEAHEVTYLSLKKKGIRSWGSIQSHRKQIDDNSKRFLIDVLAQPWAPVKGKVIELGCGTGPILRRICKKNFTGLGIDVSKTAIQMARQQSKGLNVRFKRADICKSDIVKSQTFDMAIDGHCLHCITDPKDRKAFLKNTLKLLKTNGLFIVMTMCSPIDRKLFAKMYPDQKIIDYKGYIPFNDSSAYSGSLKIKGKDYLPVRYFGHWKMILAEIKDAGFDIKLLRLNPPSKDCPNSDLAIGAIKNI